MLKMMGKKQKGFTLVELLVAMAIAAIIIPAVIYLFINSMSENSRVTDQTMATNQIKNAINYVAKDTVASGSVAVTNSNFPLTLTWITYPTERTTFSYSYVNTTLRNGVLTGTLQRNEYENDGSGNAQLKSSMNVATNVNESLTNCVWVPPSGGNNGNLTVNITISMGTINESRSITVSPRANESLTNLASTVTSLTSSPTSSLNSPSPYDGSVTFTATVSGAGGTPTGSVTFSDNGNVMNPTPINLISGTVSWTSPPYSLPPGDDDITAYYSGDNIYSPSVSAILIQWVQSTNLPVVVGISPISGPSGGGTSVIISGMNFTGATVDFGGAAAAVIADTGTSITATSPAGTGTVDVTVITSYGDSAIVPADQFTYQDVPNVTGISPSSGGLLGGTSVTISGTNFIGASAVNFGGYQASVYAVNSATSITATSPSGSGTVDVTVTTSSGTSAKTVADQFTYVPPPTVTGIAPSSGSANGGTGVTITGTNLNNAAAVNFGGNSVIIRSDTSTQITVSSPAANVGTVDVTVSTPSGTSATSAADQFTYLSTPPPTVTGISPISGSANGGTSITITGTNLNGATAVNFGNNIATITSNTATQIIASSPSGTGGTIDVTVTTPSGTSVTSSADLFTYIATTATFNPTSGPVGTTINVTGTLWSSHENITSVIVGGKTANYNLSVDRNGNLSGTITVPTSLAVGGPYAVVITGSTSGVQTFSNAFTVTVIITTATFNPTSGPVGTTINVTGTNWSRYDSINSVTVGGKTANYNLSVDRNGNLSGTITVPTSLAVGGPYAIVITGSTSGVQTFSNAFTVTMATATFSPTSGPVGTTITVIAPSSGWVPSDNISGVTIGGRNANYHLSINSSGTLSGTITVPSVSTGSQPIVITGNTSGTQTFSNAFTVTQGSSTTSVSSNHNPSTYGQSVTFTATVTGAGVTPTGTVQFTIDGTNFGGAVTLSGGNATSGATTTLSIGNHTITAIYNGDNNYLTSTGTLSGGQTVNKATSATSVSSNHNPSTYGQSVTFTASVGGAGTTPTGTVQFTIDGTNFGGAVTLLNGSATSSSTSTLAGGNHTITAIYNGDNNYLTSTGTLSGGQVVKMSSSTSVSSSQNPSPYGQSVTFTASVGGAGTTPTGTVQFVIDGTNFGGAVTLANGIATSRSTNTLSVGNHTITAIYNGDNNYLTSTGTLSGGQTVNKATSATSVSSNHNPSTPGQRVTFTASVAGAGTTPTGTVQFVIDGINFGGAVTLANGSATSSSTSTLAGGNHTVTAVYSGDSNYLTSTGTLSGGQTVN
jgi:prepilin-type N-terminal cleavage/methylation domain-containing protein